MVSPNSENIIAILMGQNYLKEKISFNPYDRLFFRSLQNFLESPSTFTSTSLSFILFWLLAIFAKSVLRVTGYLALLVNPLVAVAFLVISEALGILEELV